MLVVPSLWAQTIAQTPRGILAAHDGRIQLFDGSRRLWSAAGATNATAIVVGDRKAAVLDALANEAHIVDLATGRVTVEKTGETPIDGAFVGDALYVLARDARTLQNVRVAADPAFLRKANGKLYVYGRAEGTVEEFDPATKTIARRVKTAASASDFEVAGRFGYLTLPADGKIVMLDLETMQPHGEIALGAVPVDLSIAKSPTIAVADPSAKRVWMVEGAQSMTQAVTRGFIRGLLGLGLYANRNSQFPTAVDRVFVRGSQWIAYDSSSGTLYRFTRSGSTILAKRVAPKAFIVTEQGAYVWRNDRGMPVAVGSDQHDR